MVKRTLAFITLVLCSITSFAQNNSIWRNFDKNSVDTTAYRVTFATQTPVLDKPNKNSKALETTTKAFTSGPYAFSGGDGSAATPFLIGTPQDLINMSKAVNTKAQYNRTGATNQYYYQANYKMIADIDMSEPYPGPFIMCEKTIKNGTWTVNYEQIIQQTTASAPYTCPRVYLDTTTGNVSLADKTAEENCAVTNSNITGGYAGGGIVDRMVYPGSGSTPNGIVRNWQSLNNTITTSNAGGIVGSNGNDFGLTQVIDNIVSGNTVNGSNKGTFVSGVTDDSPTVPSSGNENYTNRHTTIISVRNELMIDGLIPDYCYIHSGISFDPKTTLIQID